MRIAGGVLTAAGLVAALAGPVLGFPAAFPVLLGAALVLWLVGAGAAAAALAPPRPVAGAAAAVAALLGWPVLLMPGLAPLWGGLAALCGVVVAAGGVRIGWSPKGGAPCP